jgi:hypothetical protein
MEATTEVNDKKRSFEEAPATTGASDGAATVAPGEPEPQVAKKARTDSTPPSTGTNYVEAPHVMAEGASLSLFLGGSPPLPRFKLLNITNN